MARTILVAGATGLIGTEVLRKALEDQRISRAIALVRRSTGLVHPKLLEWSASTDDLLSGLRTDQVDAVVCCLGTTIRNVGGDQQKFIHVDKDLVLGIARWAKERGVPTFSVVSAIGADPKSRVFYSRVKGEMEDGLRAIGIRRTCIFRPSILTGPRQEVRVGERIGIGVRSALAPLMLGKLSAYRPMRSDVLATALLESVLRDDLPEGAHTWPYAEIMKLARSSGSL